MLIDSEIEFKPEVLWEIYNTSHKEKFKRTNNNHKSILIIAFVCLSISSIPIVLNNHDLFMPFGLIFALVAIILFIYLTISYVRQVIGLFKVTWATKKWIDECSKVNSYRITVDDNKLTLYTDGTPYFYPWKDLTEAYIEDKYIWLNIELGKGLILPKKLLHTKDVEIIEGFLT